MVWSRSALMVVLPVAVDRAAGELVRRDRDAVRGRVAHRPPCSCTPSWLCSWRSVQPAAFACAVKVKLKLRGAGDVHRLRRRSPSP